MILKTDILQDSCTKILNAISKSKLDDLRDILEIQVVNNILYLNVTNREYYVSVKTQLDELLNFHASVNATTFLKLVEQFTAEDIELNTSVNSLKIKSGPSSYKLPLIYDNTEIMTLPKIDINNVTTSFIINSSNLHSILAYNSKEIAKKSFGSPVQQMYYIDNEGCITFTSSACVNKFKTDKPFKILINDTIVKLFKLFDKDTDVNVDIGFDVDGNNFQTKLKLYTNNINITTILNNDDKLINSIPVDSIRAKADAIYTRRIVVNRTELLSALNRLLTVNQTAIVKLNFLPSTRMQLTDQLSSDVNDYTEYNCEEVGYLNGSNITIDSNYECLISADSLKNTLLNCDEKTLTIECGNKQSIVVKRVNIINIIPEYINE